MAADAGAGAAAARAARRRAQRRGRHSGVELRSAASSVARRMELRLVEHAACATTGRAAARGQARGSAPAALTAAAVDWIGCSRAREGARASPWVRLVFSTEAGLLNWHSATAVRREPVGLAWAGNVRMHARMACVLGRHVRRLNCILRRRSSRRRASSSHVDCCAALERCTSDTTTMGVPGSG
jgi:hypothetical protein